MIVTNIHWPSVPGCLAIPGFDRGHESRQAKAANSGEAYVQQQTVKGWKMDGCSDRYHVLMIATTDHRHIGDKYLFTHKCPSRVEIEHRSCKTLLKKHATLRHARHGVYLNTPLIILLSRYVIFYTQENFEISRFLMDMLIQQNNLNNIIFICIKLITVL